MRFILYFTFILSLIMPLKAYNGTLHPPKDYDSLNDYLYKGLNEYKTILAQMESNHDDNAIGLNYYKGKYQIGKQAAKDINVPYDSLFIPYWSDTAVVRLMRVNWNYLEGYQKRVGSTIKGVKVTQAGLLAGCHLKGHIWVKMWLKSNGEIDGQDANGVPVSFYIRMMENVNLIKY